MGRLIAFSTLFFSVLLSGWNTAGAQGPPFRTAVFEMKVVEEKGEWKTEGLSKVWVNFNEQKFTTETRVIGPGGKRTKYTTILSEGKAYVLNMEAKTAQEFPYAEGGNVVIDWGKTPDYYRFGGIIVGTDTVAGKEADIYEFIKFEERIPLSPGEGSGINREDEGLEGLQEILARAAVQLKVRQWIWKGTDFPLKTILDYGSKRNITEIVNIAVNVEIPERVFKVPKDYSLRKLKR